MITSQNSPDHCYTEDMKGERRMTPADMFDLLTYENKQEVIRQIETLVASQ